MPAGLVLVNQSYDLTVLVAVIITKCICITVTWPFVLHSLHVTPLVVAAILGRIMAIICCYSANEQGNKSNINVQCGFAALSGLCVLVGFVIDDDSRK